MFFCALLYEIDSGMAYNCYVRPRLVDKSRSLLITAVIDAGLAARATGVLCRATITTGKRSRRLFGSEILRKESLSTH